MTYDEIQGTLSTITLGGSFESWSVEFDAIDLVPATGSTACERYIIQASFTRPDIETGKVGTGYGREWVVPLNATREQIVFTCWLAAKQIIDHEAHEAFTVEIGGAPTILLDPHKTLYDLAEGSRLVAEGRSAEGLDEALRDLFSVDPFPSVARHVEGRES